jgi:hypothetical protein
LKDVARESGFMNEHANYQRDHLFISYASEDVALAEWLTFKLTTLGYKVWCDRIKLFGGESYPEDIDAAIKNRTFRFLGLLSHQSVSKPNPLKERTIALNIAEERKEDFVIPLNLGVRKTELPWQLSDLTWVDFSKNWARGLAGLLKALRNAETPCPIENGRDMVSGSIISEEIMRNEPETIYSNFLRIKKIPQAISVIRFNHERATPEWTELQTVWAAHPVCGYTFLSFHEPPGNQHYDVRDAHLWGSKDTIEGINTEDLVSELLRKNLYVLCCKKGLVWSRDHRWMYFPFDPKASNSLSFIDSHGSSNSIKVAGERKFFSPGKSSRYRYHLAPTFRIMRNMFGEDFVVKLGLRIRITDTKGKSMQPRAAQARIKNVSKDWWNYEWVSRYLALCSFLSGGGNEIVIGEREPYKIILFATPLSYESPISLDEGRINERVKQRKRTAV